MKHCILWTDELRIPKKKKRIDQAGDALQNTAFKPGFEIVEF